MLQRDTPRRPSKKKKKWAVYIIKVGDFYCPKNAPLENLDQNANLLCIQRFRVFVLTSVFPQVFLDYFKIFGGGMVPVYKWNTLCFNCGKTWFGKLRKNDKNTRKQTKIHRNILLTCFDHFWSILEQFLRLFLLFLSIFLVLVVLAQRLNQVLIIPSEPENIPAWARNKHPANPGDSAARLPCAVCVHAVGWINE